MAAISRFSPSASNPYLSTPVALAPTATHHLIDTRLLRQVRAECFEIRKVLADSRPQGETEDETTKLIRNWFTNFSKFLNMEDGLAERALQKYIPLMQKILIDPLSRQPLGEEPLLGSDGRTYSRMSLSIHFDGVPEQFRNRSPLDPNNETPFTTQPHPVAKQLIEWLKRRNQYQPSPDEERRYHELALDGRLPAVPTSEVDATDEMFRRILVTQAAREREERKEEASDESALVAEVRAIVAAEFAPVHAAIRDTAVRNIGRVDAHTERQQRELQELSAQTERLRKDAEELRRRNEELNRHIDRTDKEVTESEKATTRLETSVNELEIASKEREAAWGEALLKTALIIGGSTFGTWAISQALAATSGMSGTMIPVPGGGSIGIKLDCIIC